MRCDRVRSSVRPSTAALLKPLADMVISGSGPNLFSELNGSKPLTGFPNPDLFDHFAHMGRRRSHTSVTGAKLFRAAPLSCSSSLRRILIVLSLCQHGPERTRHLVCQCNSHEHSWLPHQHPEQPCVLRYRLSS